MDLTDAYENGAYIPDADSIAANWLSVSSAYRSASRCELDIPYGSSDRQKFDLFLPDGAAKGLMVFIHGGYWLARQKSDWSHLARGANAHGWAVAIPGYDLCPNVRIAEITRQIAASVSAAAARIDGPLAITGHSAGGHLTARMAMQDTLPDDLAARLVGLVPISPVTDLRPLMQTAMNAELHLDMAEAEAESPALGARRDVPVHIWTGAAERPAFLDQALWLQKAWGCGLTFTEAEHHFNVIDTLEHPESPLLSHLLKG